MKKFDQTLLSGLDGLSGELREKIKDKSAVIGIVGMGYVGMPIALEFAREGYRCVGVDPNATKVEQLNNGENFIEDLPDADIRRVVTDELLSASVDYDVLRQADVIYICVPTPIDSHNSPDLSFVLSAGESVASILQKGQLIILKSTTFPGTTEDYLMPVLEKSGLSAGSDYFLAFSPERVDPGNKVFNTKNTPIVVGGVTEEGSILAGYANSIIVEEVYLVSSPKVAEMEKVLENIFRNVNIALVNELALLCERMGTINMWEVIEAAATKPFGFMKFTPGPGVGGHCISVDPFYMSWLARAYDFETQFITLAANVNDNMPYHVADLVIRQIARQPENVGEAKVLILGAAFKKNVKDTRNSPTKRLIRRLLSCGINHVDYNDPWAPEYTVDGVTRSSVELTPDVISSYNVVVLITDHDAYDIADIVKHSRHLIDTRYTTRDIQADNVTLLGKGKSA